jgi:N-acetylglucosaminyldiphosphoundecaprenol N-acetyl-beta-D-mannosaminyltransferase
MDHASKVHAVMLGVGAAFDFVAGSMRRAPKWMSHRGLEWLFRLFSEPKRLFWRYVKHNPRFILKFFRQIAARKT